MAKAAFVNQGKFTKEHDDEKHDYSFISPSDLFSTSANLIPGLSGVSGGRVLLGNKSITQAISLVNREAPLVRSTDNHANESFIGKLGKELVSVNAEHAGKVTHVSDDEIKIKDDGGTEHTQQLYNYFQLGRKTALHHTAVVKVGDTVKKGQLLATSNFSDTKGNLALGTNLRTAVMPFRSKNFEDAFALTETGAKKLIAEQVFKIRIDTRFGVETNKDKYTSIYTNKYNNTQLSHLDADGVVKVGTVLHHDDPYMLSITPRTIRGEDINLGKITKALKNTYTDNSHVWHYENPGTVVSVTKGNGQVTLQIKSERGMSVADKLSNFVGAKGVVNLCKDSEAPTDKDGNPVDLMLNSMSVTSRVAPALITSIALGKVAQKTGKHIKMVPFLRNSSVEETIAHLKKHGVDEQEELYDPITGQHFKATVGPLFVSRLTHNSEDKITERGEGSGYSMNEQPTKNSPEESAKRVGNLGTTALLSHGATAFLKDIALTRATKNPDFWRSVKLGLPPPALKTPFIFDKFIDTLRASGVNVDRKGSVFSIVPQTDKDIDKMSRGVIKEPTTYKVKGQDLVAEAGGLFDPSITGIKGDNFNHIELAQGIPNPISEDYLRKLLGVTASKYHDLVASGEIIKMLKDIHIDDEIAKRKVYLKSGKKTDRDNALKVLGFLQNLKNNKATVGDLIINKVPVLPARFRPISLMGDKVMSADVNHLYKELILNQRALKHIDKLPVEKQDALRKAQYQSVRAIYGLDDPTNPKLVEKNVKGLMASMLGTQGNSAKMSTFQSNVVNKPVDLVGRTVLVPDAGLDLDQASVPQAILWKSYSPFIIGRLVRRGVQATKAVEYVKNKHPLAEEVLMQEIKERPAVITRDPQLHKYSAQGFYLKPNASSKDNSLKMNPLIFKGQGSDSDGDMLSIHVPGGEEARKEVIAKMMPSSNLLTPSTFQPAFMPSNEASLGLFQLSTEDNKGKVHEFKSEADVVKAYTAGTIKPGDHVVIK